MSLASFLIPFYAVVRSTYDAGTYAVVFWVWSVSVFVLSLAVPSQKLSSWQLSRKLGGVLSR